MFGRSIRIGRLAGIPIGIQPLWLLIVVLITVSLGASYYPQQAPGTGAALAYGLGLLSALLLFASILLHELGHAVVARRSGVEVEEIDLWLLGGVARMSGRPEAARDELRFALAGPLVTILIAAAFGLISLGLPSSAPAALRAIVDYQLFVNAAILAFNLLPAFPLDGGRVARALLWERTGDPLRATRTAASVGRAFGFGMIALGLFATFGGYVGGLWLALIGFFVTTAGRAEESGLLIHTALEGRTARRLAVLPAVCAPAEVSVAEAIGTYFVPYRFSAFPVVERGRAVGLVTAADARRVPMNRRAALTVADIANRDPTLILDGEEDVSELVERPAFQRVGRAVVQTETGEVGIVSITDVKRVLRAVELGGGPSPPAPHRTLADDALTPRAK